jgi:hypothetical protein
MRSMAFQSTSKFFSGSRLVFGSILFIADKMGDLSLQELESLEIVGSGIDHFPPPPARVYLTCEAQLGNGSSISGESELDPSGGNADHHEMCCPDAADPIYKPSPESDSDNNQEIFMVGQAEPPPPPTKLQRSPKRPTR